MSGAGGQGDLSGWKLEHAKLQDPLPNSLTRFDTLVGMAGRLDSVGTGLSSMVVLG